MNLRADSPFVEDVGWQAAYRRYIAFSQRTAQTRIVYLELGVGFDTPGIVCYPFERFALQGKQVALVRVNRTDADVPLALRRKSVSLRGISTVLGEQDGGAV